MRVETDGLRKYLTDYYGAQARANHTTVPSYILNPDGVLGMVARKEFLVMKAIHGPALLRVILTFMEQTDQFEICAMIQKAIEQQTVAEV